MANISKRKRLFTDSSLTISLLLLILLPTFFVYSRLAGHQFVTLDDALYVFANPHVRSGLSPDNVAWAFKTMTAEFWHPLTWLSYMLDTTMFGTNPGGYLLTNLLLHLFNSAMIFLCFKRWTGRVWESWMIGLLFALHPLHVEPVAWVSGRKELLCACFWILSMLAYGAYRRRPGWWRYFSVMFFFMLGMMAKPMIVTLPFVLLLLDYWPLSREEAAALDGATGNVQFRRWKLLVMEKIPLFGISVAGIIIAIIAQQRGGGLVSAASLPLLSRISYSLVAYTVYLKNAIWPGALTPLYPPPASISGGMVVSALLVLLVITGIVIFRSRRQKYLLTGWFWFLGTLVPVIGLVKIGDFFIADRYMYMPLTGILVMLFFSLKALIDNLSHRLVWMILIPLLMAGIYLPVTVFHIRIWENSETLYTYAISVTRNNFMAHNALGNLLAARHEKAGAIEQFSKAVAIRPDKAVLWVTLGRGLAFDGQWEKAEDAFSRAESLEPDHPAVWFYKGCVRAFCGDKAEALGFLIKCLDKARQRGEKVADLYLKALDFYQNGLYYQKQGQLPLAGRYFGKAFALIQVNVSRQELTRLVAGGYDKWMKKLSG